MIGLVVLVVGAIYLVLLVLATRAAYRWAKGKGLSKAKCRLAAAGGFLAVYLPVFWDHIPTLVAHKYYCAKDAGFKVFKTIEQWKAENPGVAENLKSYGKNINELPRSPSGDILINDRFSQRYERVVVGFLPIVRWSSLLVDRAKDDVVAKDDDFQSGYGNPMTSPSSDWRTIKIWMQVDSCLSEEARRVDRGLVGYRNNIIDLGGGK